MGPQSIMLLGSIVLFSILALTVNRTLSFTDEQMLSAENISTAATLAQGMLYTVYNKEFDNSVVNSIPEDVSDFSPASSLGPESGEALSSYNDVDDFNNFTFTENTPRLGQYTGKVTVKYVSDNNFNTVLSTQSHSKLITVFIKNPQLSDSVKFSIIKFY